MGMVQRNKNELTFSMLGLTFRCKNGIRRMSPPLVFQRSTKRLQMLLLRNIKRRKTSEENTLGIFRMRMTKSP